MDACALMLSMEFGFDVCRCTRKASHTHTVVGGQQTRLAKIRGINSIYLFLIQCLASVVDRMLKAEVPWSVGQGEAGDRKLGPRNSNFTSSALLHVCIVFFLIIHIAHVKTYGLP
jgi:hypothetical protein